MISDKMFEADRSDCKTMMEFLNEMKAVIEMQVVTLRWEFALAFIKNEALNMDAFEAQYIFSWVQKMQEESKYLILNRPISYPQDRVCSAPVEQTETAAEGVH